MTIKKKKMKITRLPALLITSLTSLSTKMQLQMSMNRAMITMFRSQLCLMRRNLSQPSKLPKRLSPNQKSRRCPSLLNLLKSSFKRRSILVSKLLPMNRHRKLIRLLKILPQLARSANLPSVTSMTYLKDVPRNLA